MKSIKEFYKMTFSEYLNTLRPLQIEPAHLASSKDWIYNFVLKNNFVANNLTLTAHNSVSCESQSLNFDTLTKNITYPLVLKIKEFASHEETYVFSDLEYNYLTVQLDFKNETCYYFHLSNKDENVKSFEAFIKSKSFSKGSKNNVYVISTSRSGLSLHSMGSMDVVLEPSNYSPDVIEAYNYILEEFQKKDPYGRLAIVNGPPGVGKSFMLRSLLSSIKDSLIILLPAKMVGEIDSPGIIKLLSEERYYGELEELGKEKVKNMPIVFVLEDADACLVPRDDGNMSTISSFLNYTDGIFGSMLDMRIIATTNADRIQFDSALMRPGRLCKHIRVGHLSAQQASEVYKRLTGKEKIYEQETTLAEVYGDSYNKKVDKVKSPKTTLGFSV
jgi:hypothetical protein